MKGLVVRKLPKKILSLLERDELSLALEEYDLTKNLVSI